MLKELITINRSYRRFDQSHKISENTLIDLIELARLSASAKNEQPVRFVLCTSAKVNADIFPNLGWAGFIKDWPGPCAGERPTAYIVMLTEFNNDNLWTPIDLGIAAQSIMLGAVEKGLGGCIIAAVKREPVRKVLSIPDKYDIRLILALGKPIEKIMIDKVGSNGDTRYWREEDGTHHVPKLSVSDLVLKF